MSGSFYIPPPKLQWQEQTPRAADYDDIYFSQGLGVEESHYVFLEQNRLPQRWKEGAHFTIAETGFGTALNFLLTWQLWRENSQSGQRLHFISVEGHPLTRDDLCRATAPWPSLQPLVKKLLVAYPASVAGTHRLQLDDNVSLTLLFGDISEVLPSLHARVDAWFLDGFDPAKNPAMWRDHLYQQMARLTVSQGTFATFTAAGKVRRGLQAAGFEVQKIKGFGRKREMLRGRLPHATKSTSKAPWFELPKPVFNTNSTPRAVIIGAGMAGAACAYQLSRHGWQVSVVDKHPTRAQGASGNPVGAFYPALSNDLSPYSRFYLSAFLYTTRCFSQWQAAGKQFGLLGKGLLQLAYDDLRQQRQHGIIKRLGESAIALPLDREQASQQSGLPQQTGGIFFPQGGWLDPGKLCAFLLQTSQAEQHYNTAVNRLIRTKSGWRLITDQCELAADVVVIAAGDGIRHLQQSQPLPITIARGQISLLTASEQSKKLKCAICHEGYLLPAVNNQHVVGASYGVNDRDTRIRQEDRQHNLTLLKTHQSDFFEYLDINQHAEERVGLRATTQDRLPLVGAIPDHHAYVKDYATLHHGHRPTRYPSPSHLDGLYILGGLSSRGITSALLSAELLACQINGEPLPLPQALVDALNPARFLVRDLKRGKWKTKTSL